MAAAAPPPGSSRRRASAPTPDVPRRRQSPRSHRRPQVVKTSRRRAAGRAARPAEARPRAAAGRSRRRGPGPGPAAAKRASAEPAARRQVRRRPDRRGASRSRRAAHDRRGPEGRRRPRCAGGRQLQRARRREGPASSLRPLIAAPLTTTIEQAVVGGTHVLRADVVGFSSAADAKAFCKSAAEVSKTCWVRARATPPPLRPSPPSRRSACAALSPPADREVGQRLQRLAPLAARKTSSAALARRRSRRRDRASPRSAPAPTISSRARRKSASVCSRRPIARSQNAASRGPERAIASSSGSVALPSRKSSPAFLPRVSAAPP